MATLTIADLDNGQRDLQTVDAVANSPQDFTTTRFGDNVLTLSGALRRLGYKAPVAYASGLNVDSALFTVSHDGVIYAPDPALVPFMTGAWNAAQWRPVQNTANTNQIYQFPTLGAAEAASATLPERTTVIVEGASQGHVEGGQYVVDGGVPAITLKGYAELRAYTGKAAIVDVTNGGIAGRFIYIAVSIASDDGGVVIVGADGRRWVRNNTGTPKVCWWGAVGDGTDEHSKFAAAIAYCGSVKKDLEVQTPKTHYVLGSTLRLVSSGWSVGLIGETEQWMSHESIKIKGDIAGPLLDVKGTSLSDFVLGARVLNLTLENLSTDASACIVDCTYTGGFTMEWCSLISANYAVFGSNEVISPIFNEVCITSPLSIANATGKAGYKLHARNPKFLGGRIYAQEYCWDISGDSFYMQAVNCEFSQVICRHGAVSSVTFVNCHLETSQCLLTNATTVPINYSGNWVDNGSSGVGITGGVSFIGGICFFDTTTRTNRVVIKSGPGFTYRLSFEGMTFVGGNPIVGDSFTAGQQSPLPSGTKVYSHSVDGLTIVKPPVNSFSGYEVEGTDNVRAFSRASAQFFDSGVKSGPTSIAASSSGVYPSGVGQYGSAVFDVSWRGYSSGYEYTATVRCVQSYNTMKIGTVLSAVGPGSADAHWSLTWDASNGNFVVSNFSGATQNVVVVVDRKAMLS